LPFTSNQAIVIKSQRFDLWEGKQPMIRRLSSAIYWILSCLALFYISLPAFLYSKGEEISDTLVISLPLGVVSWCIGWGIRYVIHNMTDPYKEAGKLGILFGNIVFAISSFVGLGSIFIYFTFEELQPLFGVNPITLMITNLVFWLGIGWTFRYIFSGEKSFHIFISKKWQED